MVPPQSSGHSSYMECPVEGCSEALRPSDLMRHLVKGCISKGTHVLFGACQTSPDGSRSYAFISDAFGIVGDGSMHKITSDASLPAPIQALLSSSAVHAPPGQVQKKPRKRAVKHTRDRQADAEQPVRPGAQSTNCPNIKQQLDQIREMMETIAPEAEKLDANQQQLKAAQDQLETDQRQLKADQDQLATDQCQLKADQDQLKSDREQQRAAQHMRAEGLLQFHKNMKACYGEARKAYDILMK